MNNKAKTNKAKVNKYPLTLPKHFLPPPSSLINKQEFNIKLLSQFFQYKPEMPKIILTTLPMKMLSEQSSRQSFLNDNNSYKTNMTFDEKVIFFKNFMKRIKIDWQKGHDLITISNRDNIIKESITQLNTIDIYKELKINFEGEVNQDAGGLLREWITMLFTKLQSPEEELFEKTDTNEITYKLYKGINNSKETLSKLNFIGKIIGKVLMEGLTFNSCFNIMIFKIILDEDITLNDMVNIDSAFYNSLKQLQVMNNKELALFNFVSTDFNGEDIPLIVNGNRFEIDKNNVEYFIQQKIKFYVDRDRMLINEIKNGLFSVIPDDLIRIFTAEELALVINGVPFIDVNDWRNYTEYYGYDKNDIIINDFWNYVYQLNQVQLRMLLQFCTGSKGVPIGGFKALISNRDKESPFTITKVTYEEGKENYIRAHTCFNRLDLPCYPDKNLLYKAIKFIVDNDILGFGIE